MASSISSDTAALGFYPDAFHQVAPVAPAKVRATRVRKDIVDSNPTEGRVQKPRAIKEETSAKPSKTGKALTKPSTKSSGKPLPKAPKEPKAPKAPKEPKASKEPKAPKAPKEPKEPKAHEAPNCATSAASVAPENEPVAEKKPSKAQVFRSGMSGVQEGLVDGGANADWELIASSFRKVAPLATSKSMRVWVKNTRRLFKHYEQRLRSESMYSAAIREAHLTRLLALGQDAFAALEGAWLSDFKVDGILSADDIDARIVDTGDNELPLHNAFTIYRAATLLGVKPLGVVPHNTSRIADADGVIHTTFKVNVDGTRVYIGATQSLQDIRAHPLCVNLNDRKIAKASKVPKPSKVPKSVEDSAVSVSVA